MYMCVEYDLQKLITTCMCGIGMERLREVQFKQMAKLRNRTIRRFSDSYSKLKAVILNILSVLWSFMRKERVSDKPRYSKRDTPHTLRHTSTVPYRKAEKKLDVISVLPPIK